MHSNDTKNQFIEMRAKGWSLARIAAQLSVSQRTLVDWNRHSRAEISALRAVEVEALQEKILLSHEQDLTNLVTQLKRVEEEIAKREMRWLDEKDLFRTASLLRSEIRKARLHPDPAAELQSQPSTPTRQPA